MTANAQTSSLTNALKQVSFFPVLMLLIAILFLTGCAGPKYQQDYRPTTDFSHLKTYNWRQISSEIAGTDKQQIQNLADRQLTAQGFTRVASNPDFLLDMTLVTRISTGSSTGIGLSVGVPIGPRGSIGVGGGKSVPNDKLRGVIVVDATDTASNSIIWRGSAEEIPMDNFSLRSEDRLAAVLAKLLQQFPPR